MPGKLLQEEDNLLKIDPKQYWQVEGALPHWCPKSQVFAPAHVLLHYIGVGWKPSTSIEVVRFYFRGYRHVDIYHFTLNRNEEHVEMPVLANPVVLNIVEEYKLTIANTNVRCEQTKRKGSTFPVLSVA
jgi:hypothetical protein